MNVNKRKDNILNILNKSVKPVSGSQIAEKLGVSRQIIVQDIALLRASGVKVISTPKGYMVAEPVKTRPRRLFFVKHNTDEILDELCTIVDNGGKILDVHVEHEIYGNIVTTLIISNRQDVYDFVNQVNKKEIVPLKELTNNNHSHTVEADSEEILDRIEIALNEKNYLIIP